MAGSGPAAVVIEPHVVPPPGPIMPNDPDVAALKQAQHEAALEEQGQPTSPPPPPPPATVPPPPPPPAAPAAGGDKTVIGRLNDALSRVSSVLEENAALKGAISVLERNYQPPNAAPAAPPEDPIGDRLTEIQTEKETLAEKLDANEITNKEYVAATGRLDAEAIELNNQVILETVKANQPAPAKGDGTAQVLAKAHVEGLKARHPYLAAIVGPDMDMLAHLAHTEAAQQGVTYGDDLGSLLAFREHLGRLSDKYGPILRPDVKPGAAPAAPAPNGNGARPLTPVQQIRAAKLDLKRAAPPDPVGQGAPAQGKVEMSDSQYENMPAHEAEKLPQAVRDRLLYGS